jgi:MOSC domain-containing protein YiiM
MVRTLDIDGDAQPDLAGHGGEHRAVFVYQMDSYHYWERFLGRRDLLSVSKVEIACRLQIGRTSVRCPLKERVG